MIVIKSFKVRLYPTKDQEDLMWKHVDAARYIWNHMIGLQQANHELGNPFIQQFDMIRMLTFIKKEDEHKWLCEVSNTCLQIVCTDLYKTYTKFFNHIINYPRFKSSKHSRKKFPVDAYRIFFVDDKYIQIVKFGRVKYKGDFPVIYGKEMHYRNPRIEYVDNKWILTMSVEFESQEHTLNTTPLGIDVGVKTMITAAYGDGCISFANINKTKKMRYLQKRVKHLHHDLSRKYEQSKQGKVYVVTNNIRKTKNKLHKAYKRISDIRSNYIHQCTRKLINLYPSKIVIEDLNVESMRKNRCLSKAVSDACLSTILYQIRYKAEFNNIPIILADRFYRSSKLCSKCGNIKYDLKLSDRIYHCESCGLVIDRDFNAALNLQKYTA